MQVCRALIVRPPDVRSFLHQQLNDLVCKIAKWSCVPGGSGEAMWRRGEVCVCGQIHANDDKQRFMHHARPSRSPLLS